MNTTVNNAEQTQTTGRFKIGEKQIVIYVDFTPKGLRFGPLYFPWDDQLNAIHLRELTCAEHHKVPWEHDPKKEKKYDGYIFQDDQNQPWHNQYPNASYGQLDTDADWFIRPLGDRYNPFIKRYTKFEEISRYLERLQRGILEFSKMPENAEKMEALSNFYLKICDQLKEQFNITVEMKPHEFKTTDGKTHVLENWLDCILIRH